MSEVCRTCLQVIEDTSDMNFLSDLEPNTELLTLGQKLAACVPELMIINGVLCWSCATALRCAYGFKQQCFEAEDRIKTYLQKSSTGFLDLKEVVNRNSAQGNTNLNVVQVPQLSPQNFFSTQNIQNNLDVPRLTLTNELIAPNTPGFSENSVFTDEVNGLNVNMTPSIQQNTQMPQDLKSYLLNGAGNFPVMVEPSLRVFEKSLLTTKAKIDVIVPRASSTVVPQMKCKANSSVLLKQLLNDKTYVCKESECTYKTAKMSKFEIHKRVHVAQKTPR